MPHLADCHAARLLQSRHISAAQVHPLNKAAPVRLWFLLKETYDTHLFAVY